MRKGRETRDQIANICWIIEKAREFQKRKKQTKKKTKKNPPSLTTLRSFNVWITTNRKILKEIGNTTHPYLYTGFLRSLYAGQEATVKPDNGLV